MSLTHFLRDEIEEKLNDLIHQMTLEEKIGQTNQIYSFRETDKVDVFKGRIGSIVNATDAFVGSSSSPSANAEICNAIQRIAVNESRLKIPILFGRDVIHGYRTIFPIPLGQAASWNPELVELACSGAADEATSNGIKWTFGPVVDIARDPRWGRVAESFGEDPFLVSKMSEAAVKGFQGSDMSQATKLVGCVKHFAGYGAVEGGRDGGSAEIPIRTIRDIYLPPFHAAINAGVGTVMAGLHDLSGIPMAAHRQLLTDVLRLEWGFKGFVVSDWSSIGELVYQGVARDKAKAASLALFAGVDMDMVSKSYIDNLTILVEQDQVKVENLDEAVRRILRIKHLAGLFDQPFTDPRRAATSILSYEHCNSARLLAQQSIVLLKNEAEILPMDTRFKRIAILGPLIYSQKALVGAQPIDGRVDETKSIADAIKEIKPKDVELYFAESFDEAVHLSTRVDIAIVVLGEHPVRTGDNPYLPNLGLPQGQCQFLEAIYSQGVPIVLIILGSRPLAISKEVKLANAVFYAWHPGSQGAFALAELLFGLASPSGKLPITIPRSTGQIPIYYNHKKSGRSITTYLDQNRSENLPPGPLFPFGYGNSYTSFRYSNLKISAAVSSGPFSIEADITNTGKRPGCEVAQLYVQDQYASVTRPVKELKGFQRFFLNPGETKHISFLLRASDLTFTGLDNLSRLEPGEYRCWISPNSSEGIEGEFYLDF